MKKTTFELSETSFQKAMPRILELMPDAVSCVKADKGGRTDAFGPYDYCIYAKNENIWARWYSNKRAGTYRGPVPTGSRLTIFDNSKEG